MSTATSKGAWIGTVCLVILVFQNSLFFLATHEGRVPDEEGHVYYAPTMVVLVELIKALISFGILFYSQYANRSEAAQSSDKKYLLLPTTEQGGDHEAEITTSLNDGRSILTTFSNISSLVFTKKAWKLCIPATLYVIQTNLAVIGAQNLDSTSFIIASQLKFAATALCTSIMLKRVIGLKRWISLGTLALGVLLVQLAGRSLTSDNVVEKRSPILGFASIVGACFISGFASVFLEKILKDGNTNLWATNIQLGTFSLFPAVLPLFVDAWSNELLHPFLYFGFWAWATVAANVSGGLVVALIMKYADNIQKSLAISASIVLTFVITVLTGKVEAQAMAIAGSGIVIASIVAYNTWAPNTVKVENTSLQEEEEEEEMEPLTTVTVEHPTVKH